MKRFFAGVLVGLLLLSFFPVSVSADCRGCCSHHGGVVCRDGVTECRDGTPLSSKCRAKGCDKCYGYDTSEDLPAPPADQGAGLSDEKPVQPGNQTPIKNVSAPQNDPQNHQAQGGRL